MASDYQYGQMQRGGPPAFVTAASSVFGVDEEVLRRAKRNETVAFSTSTFSLESDGETAREKLFGLSAKSISHQQWRKSVLTSSLPSSSDAVPLAATTTTVDDMILRYGRLKHKLRKLRQLDECRVNNLHAIAMALVDISPSATHSSKTVQSSDATLGLCAPFKKAILPARLEASSPGSLSLRRLPSSSPALATALGSRTPSSSSSSSSSSRSLKAAASSATSGGGNASSVNVSGNQQLKERVAWSKDAAAALSASKVEEATFWRWVDSAAREAVELGELPAVGHDLADAPEFIRCAWARLDKEVLAAVPMAAALEEAVSELFAAGAVRPAEMAKITSKTAEEIAASGILQYGGGGGGELAVELDSFALKAASDLRGHPVYAALRRLGYSHIPLGVGTALAKLREGHARTLETAAAVAEPSSPFDFVIGSDDPTKLGRVRRGGRGGRLAEHLESPQTAH